MEVAYLISAHHQPKHLAKLVNALLSDWAYIFIHIDSKSDIAQFQSLIPENSHVFFLKSSQRVRVNWGGLSQVLATLNLLKVASNFGRSFTRYCFLSGSDFPIKSNEDIKAEFSTSKEFIRIDRKLDFSNQTKQSRNIKYFYFRDQPNYGGNFFSGIIPRSQFKMHDIYHGASWWALTKECVEYILEFLEENNGYLNFYRYTNCSDEMLFHSIIKNSPFCKYVTHDFERDESLNELPQSSSHGCHYIDWSKGSKSPKTLVADDWNSLVNSEALFARKFDEKKSKEIITLIEQRILVENFPLKVLY